jgi:protein phosphatase inhibitor 2
VFSDSDEEMTEEQKAEREQFKEKRKEHYAMEAKLALKRARELMDQDEAAEGVEDEEEGDGGMEVDEVDGGFLNGQAK